EPRSAFPNRFPELHGVVSWADAPNFIAIANIDSHERTNLPIQAYTIANTFLPVGCSTRSDPEKARCVVRKVSCAGSSWSFPSREESFVWAVAGLGFAAVVIASALMF